MNLHQFYGHATGLQPLFVGEPEDCGYTKTANGWKDANGNTGEMRNEPFDPENDEHVGCISFAYGGEEGTIDDVKHFMAWLMNECGMSADEYEKTITYMVREGIKAEAQDN